MLNTIRVEENLQAKHIRPTAMRILVYKLLNSANKALALADIEHTFSTAERTTLLYIKFRMVRVLLNMHCVNLTVIANSIVIYIYTFTVLYVTILYALQSIKYPISTYQQAIRPKTPI